MCFSLSKAINRLKQAHLPWQTRLEGNLNGTGFSGPVSVTACGFCRNKNDPYTEHILACVDDLESFVYPNEREKCHCGKIEVFIHSSVFREFKGHSEVPHKIFNARAWSRDTSHVFPAAICRKDTEMGWNAKLQAGNYSDG